jgi:uncharacterized protein YbaR (Trm112 family)
MLVKLIRGKEMIDKELLDILACPACKADVELKENKIVCKKCNKKYPIRDGIPVMLIDEAEE